MHARQFHPTHEDALDIIMIAAAPRRGERVLEPSCGDGRLAVPLLDAGCMVLAVDIDHDRTTALRGRSRRLELWTADFLCLSFHPERRFDLVLMNPPFRPRRDVEHVLHAWEHAVTEGGRVVAVVSAGWCHGKGGKQVDRLRKLVAAHGHRFSLPDNHAPGATKKTDLLVIHKPVVSRF